MLMGTEKLTGAHFCIQEPHTLSSSFSVSFSLSPLSYQLSSPGPLQVVGSVALCSYAPHSIREQREFPGSLHMGIGKGSY